MSADLAHSTWRLLRKLSVAPTELVEGELKVPPPRNRAVGLLELSVP